MSPLNDDEPDLGELMRAIAASVGAVPVATIIEEHREALTGMTDFDPIRLAATFGGLLCAAKPIISRKRSAFVPFSKHRTKRHHFIGHRGQPSARLCCGDQTLPKAHDGRPRAKAPISEGAALRIAEALRSVLWDIGPLRATLLHHAPGHDRRPP